MKKIRHTMTAKKRAEKLLKTAPVDWRREVDRCDLPPSEWQAVIQELAGVAQTAAMLEEYLECRTGGYTCEDLGHDVGVSRANKVLARVRGALGYTYPEKGTFNF